jgi:repressor LexA
MREVLEHVGLTSTGALAYQYEKLEASGYLRQEPGRARTIEVRLPGEALFPSEAVEAGEVLADTSDADRDQVIWVPVIGRIAAGSPVLAEESSGGRGHLPLPREVVGGREGAFILEVVGDSMIGVGIFPGDWVVVCPLFEAPKNGDIVAATINGAELEGTVKTYQKVGRQIWLMPQNPAYTPIPGGKARYAGKVVAVLRRV